MRSPHGAAPLRRLQRHLPQRGGRISYLESAAPEGSPTLVFLHANGFHAGVYRRLLEPLAGGVRILAPDLRGHGRTELPADTAALSDWRIYEDDLEAFLDALEIDVAWMAGHSLGGVVPARLATRSPARVRGLALADPVFLPRWILAVLGVLVPLGQGSQVGPARLTRRRRDGWADRAAARAHYEGRDMFLAWPEGWLADFLADGLVERSDGTVGLACTPAWETRTFTTVPRDIWRIVGGVRCPTTIVYGGNSSAFRGGSARMARRLIPGVRLVPVAGASHFVPMEHPEVVQEEIRSMLSLP